MSLMRRKNFSLILGIAAVAALLSSCVGIDAKIKIGDSGAGTLAAEYRLSDELLSLGELDQNKSQLPVPLSRADVENSLKKGKGLSLKSWSSAKSGKDTLIKMSIAFDSIDALVAYLDPAGKLARHTSSGGTDTIDLLLGDDFEPLESDTKELAIKAFESYSFKFSIEAPKPIKSATSSNSAIASRIEGKTAYFDGEMKDIVTTEKAPSFSVSW